MDVIAGAAFGLEVDSLKNPNDQFHRHGQGMIDTFNSRIVLFGTCRNYSKGFRYLTLEAVSRAVRL